MDALLEAIGKLIGTFKEPVQVLLLLVALGEAFVLYKLIRFLMDNYTARIDASVKLATSLDGLSAIIKEKIK